MRPERRRRSDLLAAAAIVVVVVVSLVVVWVRSDARGTTSVTAAVPLEAPATALTVPERLDELWRHTPDGPGGPDAVIAGGAVVIGTDDSVSGLDPASGVTVWSYTRDTPLCGVVGSWDTAVAVFRDSRGCGQVTQLTGSTGERAAQRSSDADPEVQLSSDGTYVVSRGPTRLEIWRSDLVRTLEYGRVDAPVNPGDQPRAGCELLSSASSSTRTAVLEQCANEAGPRLTSMNPAPKDASEPDVYGSTILTDVPAGRSGARLIAVSGDRIGAYLPASAGAAARVASFDGSGNFLNAEPVTETVDGDAGDGAATTAVGPTLSWWTGSATLGLSSSEFLRTWTLPGALGAGASIAGRLLVPVPDALLVVDPADGTVQSSLPVDRGDWTGPVSVSVIGSRIIEQRGETTVALG